MILADNDEALKHSSLLEKLSEMGVSVETTSNLGTDFVVVGLNLTLGLEYKLIGDLLNSIVSGRLYRQLRYLETNFNAAALIYQGLVAPNEHGELRTDGYETRWRFDSVQGILFSLGLKGIIPVHTSSEFATALTLRTIHDQLQKEGKHQLRREKVKGFFPDESSALELLCALPDINLQLATALWREFKTPIGIFTAGLELPPEVQEVIFITLQKTKGIGPARARQIVETLFKVRREIKGKEGSIDEV